MRLFLTGAFTALLVLLPLVGAHAESTEDKAKGTKYEEAKGLYAYTGFTVAKTNYSSNLDPNIGFALGGGYRFLSWLGSDVDFYWAGRDQGGGKTRQFGLTFNGKVYPLGLFAPKTLQSFQPYAVVGMGGGNFKIKDAGAANGKRGTFIFRMGVGLDWLITEHMGMYTDVSLHATPGLKIGSQGGATGVYQLGLKYNF